MSTADSRVFVLDGESSVRRRLELLLTRHGHAVEAFGTAADYLARTRHEGPACLVLELELSGLGGFELQQRLADAGRSEPIVFITRENDLATGVQAMKRGAVDVLLKPVAGEALLGAVALGLARAGAEWSARGEIMEGRTRIADLTAREFEVLRLLTAGHLNKQIAAHLGASLRTIKRHRAAVMQKLGVVSIAELVRLTQKAGVEPAHRGPKVPYTSQSSVASLGP